MKPIIEIQNMDLIYHSKKGETLALKDINLNVFDGEFISIVGPSGCGKTTLLSIISGLIKPTKGKITIKGSEPDTKSNTTGYMFQKDNLLPWKTIEKNIFYGLDIQHISNKENKDYALDLLKKYGLYDFKNKHPDELSGGMRQRVALIRTLALHPDILLLDEPFGALDFQNRLKVCDDVATIIKNEKKTAILVTHDLNEAISLSDKIYVLTKRPGTIKTCFLPKFEKGLTPFEKRNTVEAKKLFEKIWKEIQDEK